MSISPVSNAAIGTSGDEDLAATDGDDPESDDEADEDVEDEDDDFYGYDYED